MNKYPIRILLIDDDEDEYIIIEEMFYEISPKRFQLDWVATYNEGLESMISNQYDVYLLDYRLGRHNGLELLEQVKGRCKKPIIMLTGLGSREVDIAAMKAGAMDYLEKGKIEPSLLERSIRYAIERHKLIDALRESEERYRILFENSPISLWEEDFSRLKNYIENLRISGVRDFRRYFENNPEEVAKCISMIKVVNVNKATEELYEAESKNELVSNLDRILTEESYNTFEKEIISLIEGQTRFESETVHQTLKGKDKYVFVRRTLVSGYEKTWSKIFASIVDITERKQAEKELAYMATHDTLTGLPNRVLLNDRFKLAIAHARRYNQKLGLMLLDLDNFKKINDTFGHHVGDEFLKAVAKRLKEILRKSDTIARIGGDEFILLLPEISGYEGAEKVAQRITDAFQEKFVFDEYELNITASIGTAIYPDNGKELDTLMRNADMEMYRLKKRR